MFAFWQSYLILKETAIPLLDLFKREQIELDKHHHTDSILFPNYNSNRDQLILKNFNRLTDVHIHSGLDGSGDSDTNTQR